MERSKKLRDNIMKQILFLLFITTLMFSSCGKKVGTEQDQTAVVHVKTTTVKFGKIESKQTFNGKVIYLKKNQVLSPISGFIRKMTVKFGDTVKKGDLLFEIQTKENKALENSNSGNMGLVSVKSPSSGVINQLNIVENGAYIVEGAALCTVAENQDALVQLNLPFEYNSLVKVGAECTLVLGDDIRFRGTILQILPTVDEANQTQQILIKPYYKKPIPENLNLEVEIVKAVHNHTYLAPRNAVLTNETQTEFWVMKVLNNKLAIKVPVKKGIENDEFVEILNANLTASDVLVSEGGYGLNDSTEVSTTVNGKQ